jgi:hypothetical protein
LPREAFLAKLLATRMPTAIIRTYTPSGFVVAADGRSTNSVTKKVTSDKVQKLFRLGDLMCSFTGGVQLGRADSEETEEVLFNFIAELMGAGQATSLRRFHGLQEYAQRISEKVNQKLEQALRRGNISLPSIPSDYPGDYAETILLAFVEGYHNNLPSRVRIRFCHDQGKLLPPHVITEQLKPSIPVIVGIPEIGRLIQEGDPRMRGYMEAVNLDDSYNNELAFAINFSRAFIRACGGPEAHEIDPEVAHTIGGAILIATVTNAHGFRWVADYAPMPSR